MTSLRSQLLLWLLPLYIAVAVVAMLVSYRQYQSSVNAFMDGQIHALARSEVRRLSAASKALPAVQPVDDQAVQHHGTPVIQFWSSDRRLLASSHPILSVGLRNESGFGDIEDAGQRWRAYTVLSSPVSVQILQSDDFRHRVILDSALKSAEPVIALIPFSVVLLWLAVHLALRPLDRLVRAMAHKDERSLSELPPARIPSEIAPLIASMNGLLKRLREAFISQQRFVQDAAHELRTPLASFVLQVESLRARLGDDVCEELDRLEAGVRRHRRLIEQLLKLARQDSVDTPARPEPTDLGDLLRESVAEFVPIADQRRIGISGELREGSTVSVDRNDLRCIFDNLLGNCLRYTPTGGHVKIALRDAADGLVVEFADTGPGIPPELLEQVFDRFYRVPGASAEGSGLGLALVRAAAQHAGIGIELQNREDRGGLRARVRIRVHPMQ